MTLPDLRKPEKRAPRPRRAIKRTKRPRRQRKTTRGQMGRTADRLFSLIVRSPGKCAYHACAHGGSCTGSLQCAHVFSRRYRNVRWDEDNAMPLCAGAHITFTHDPLRWERFVIARMGEDAYSALKERALRPWNRDIESVLVRLAARAVALGIDPGKKGA